MFVLIFVATAVVLNGVNSGVNESSVNDLKLLSKYEENVTNMRNIVESLEEELKEEENNLNKYNNPDNFDDIKSMNALIKELKLYNGFTNVRGPGIMIRVSDNTSDDEGINIMQKIVHDVDITVLINDLKNAGAEAIDVNGKRIVNITEIVCAGPVLKINGEAVPAPFIMRVIGDQQKLYDAVTKEGTYAYDLKNKYGMEVAVMKSYNLNIPKYYDYNYQIKYANSIYTNE